MKSSEIENDHRLAEISNQLIQYSLGNFEGQLPITQSGDGIDAIVAGVNMLGEELKHVTLSRDSMSRVYNSIAELLFVTDVNGKIEDVNTSTTRILQQSKYNLLNKSIFDFIQILPGQALEKDLHYLHHVADKITVDGSLNNHTDVRLKCNFSLLKDVNDKASGVLLVAEDITDKLATEKRIIRAIIDTQEKERNRFAADLHDSLGQQLSGIRFYISALEGALDEDEIVQAQFRKTLKFIDNAAADLRNICFNLMPRTLENHTLHFSLEELANKFSHAGMLNFKIDYAVKNQSLAKEFEIACFRIVQEFLNNALKHGQASEVTAQFKTSKNQLILHIADNGIGYDQAEAANRSGMGLRNIKTRVESYFGKLEIISSPGKGCQMKMKFPLPFITLQNQNKGEQ